MPAASSHRPAGGRQWNSDRIATTTSSSSRSSNGYAVLVTTAADEPELSLEDRPDDGGSGDGGDGQSADEAVEPQAERHSLVRSRSSRSSAANAKG